MITSNCSGPSKTFELSLVKQANGAMALQCKIGSGTTWYLLYFKEDANGKLYAERVGSLPSQDFLTDAAGKLQLI